MWPMCTIEGRINRTCPIRCREVKDGVYRVGIEDGLAHATIVAEVLIMTG